MGVAFIAILAAVIPLLFHFIDGLVFGLTGLIGGSIAIIQVKRKQESGTGYRLAIIGIVLGVLGIISNVIFTSFFLMGMLRD